MAYELQSIYTTGGLGDQAGLQVMTLKRLATLSTPITEAVMRAEVESGQPVGFMTDNEWQVFAYGLASLSVVDASLTATERSVLNVLKTVAAPPPQQQCCTTSGVIPSNSDGLSAIQGQPLVGSATFEHKILILLDNTYTCDIASVTVSITPTGAAPAVTSTNPFDCYFDSCNVDTDSLFSYVWATFASDPTGESYDVIYTYKDANGTTIATYAANYTLDL